MKRPGVGFCAAAFYLLLAPTSSVIPIMSEVAGERRMYLPLLPVMALVVVAVAWTVRRWVPASRWPAAAAGGVGFALAAVVTWSAVTVFRVQDYQSSEQIWRQTLRVQPGSLYARSNLANALMRGQGLDEAERLLREIQVEAPGFPQLNGQLARVAFRRNQFDLAADLFLKSAHSNYGKPKDYAYAGFALIVEGKREAGAYALGKALELAPEDPTALNFVATVLSKDGKYADAVDYLEKILDNYPEMSDVWSNLGHNLKQLGRTDEARAAFRAGFEQNAENLGLLRNFGNFEALEKNYEAAATLFRLWLQIEPHASEPLLKLVTVLVESGDDAAAKTTFKRLIVLHPFNVEARQRYAWWLLNTGNTAEAARQAETARELDPENDLTKELDEAIAAFTAEGSAAAVETRPVQGEGTAPSVP